MTAFTTETTIEAETFKPIDKFDNFSIICSNNNDVAVKGIKNNKELLVLSADVNVMPDMISSINYFLLTSVGDIKIIYSTDSGVTWYSYYNSAITKLNCVVPLKSYSSLTADELTSWNNTITEIETYGMNVDTFRSIDFETITISNLRFAYLINRVDYTSISEIQKNTMNYNTLGHLTKAKKDDYDAMLFPYALKVSPLSDSPIVKVNALLSETLKKPSTDNRTIIETPVLTMASTDTTVTLSWNTVAYANYYKVYLNGVLIGTTSELTYTYNLADNKDSFAIFCIRACANDTTLYKSSNLSNMLALDLRGYLATAANVYVGIKKGGTLYKFMATR
jgi:hypothetical protein